MAHSTEKHGTYLDPHSGAAVQPEGGAAGEPGHLHLQHRCVGDHLVLVPAALPVPPGAALHHGGPEGEVSLLASF